MSNSLEAKKLNGLTITGAATTGQVLTATSATHADWETPTVVTPSGSDTQIQFNNGGMFGGSANLTWDGNTVAILGLQDVPILSLNDSNNDGTFTITGKSGGVHLSSSGTWFLDFNGTTAIVLDSGVTTVQSPLDVNNNLHVVGFDLTVDGVTQLAGTNISVAVDLPALTVSNGTKSIVLENDSDGGRIRTDNSNLFLAADGFDNIRMSGAETFFFHNIRVGGDIESDDGYQLTSDSGDISITPNTSKVGINTGSPGYALDVAGDVNSSTRYRLGGQSVLTSGGGKFQFGDVDNVGGLGSDFYANGGAVVFISGTNGFLGVNQPTPAYPIDTVDRINVSINADKTKGYLVNGNVVATLVTSVAYYGDVNDTTAVSTSIRGGALDALTVNGSTGLVTINTLEVANSVNAASYLVAGVAAVPTWTKYTVPYSAFSVAANTNAITLFTLPAGGFILGVKIKHSTAFSGGGLTAYTISVGITGNDTKFASPFDVFQAVSGTAFQATQNFDSEDHDNPTTINIVATSTGDTLDNVTAGSVDVWVLTSVTQ